jgi:large subunit ribosomal protein L10
MLERYPVVGVLDITDLPAAQFQQMRRKLRGQAEIRVAKNTIMTIAIGQAAGKKDPKLKELVKYLRGQSALIFAQMNPFRLTKILESSKTSAPAKPGVKSPKDIVIPAGETEFAPGPVVGELQRAGIKARIQAGKVVILEDCHILKQGDIITKEIVDAISKFGIQPMELGLKLHAAYEAGMIFPAQVLMVDEKQVVAQLQLACVGAVNLAVTINYPTKVTIGVMISKASAAARNLALNAWLPIADVMPTLLAKARAEMLGLAGALLAKDEKALGEELKKMLAAAPPAEKLAEEKKPVEEKPKEEKKEEEMAGLGALFG